MGAEGSWGGKSWYNYRELQPYLRKKRRSKKFVQNSQIITCVRVSFFNEVACLRSATLLKTETPTQLFSCEFCKIFKNVFFREHLQAAAANISRYIIYGAAVRYHTAGSQLYIIFTINLSIVLFSRLKPFVIHRQFFMYSYLKIWPWKIKSFIKTIILNSMNHDISNVG